MRIFVALQPAPAFRDALASLQDRLRAAGVTGRYLTPSNLHLTLAFIGMWPEDISGLLPSVQNPFPVTLSHLGIFPGAKVLWAGVDPSEALNALAQNVSMLNHLNSLGVMKGSVSQADMTALNRKFQTAYASAMAARFMGSYF